MTRQMFGLMRPRILRRAAAPADRTTMRLPKLARRISTLTAALASIVLSASIASPAVAQTPVAPADGQQVTGSSVVLRWTAEPGWYTQCVQWSTRPETSHPGGPFLAPQSTTCGLDSQDVAYLLDDLGVQRYYWHVLAEREGAGGIEDVYGPTAYFDAVEPPPPPRPTGCSNQAAAAMADDFILPYAVEHYPSYYADTADAVDWFRSAPVCRDLDGDGNREMIVRLSCCTGGSLSPWAIFKHNTAGQWQMAYAQVRDTVFRLALRRRVVRTMLPAPYEGGCTRYVRYREVRWSGSRFRSRLTRRSRARLSRGC
jgi:hypothetical protein